MESRADRAATVSTYVVRFLPKLAEYRDQREASGPRLFEQPVFAQPAQNPGHLSAVGLREPGAQRLVLHPADRERTASEGREEGFVVPVEEAEATIGPCPLGHHPCDFVELVGAMTGIVDGRQKLQVPPVGCA